MSDSHRKFLKEYSHEYQLGTYFPEELILQANTEPLSFEWIRHSKHGSLVFMVSATCMACRMEPIQKFVDHYKDFEYCVFFEGSRESMNTQKEIYDFDIPFYQCDSNKIQKHLKINVVPYVLVLNKIGQVVSAGIFNDYGNLKQLANSLIRVYERSTVSSI